ncbi:lipase 3-like, partial [Frieseomelitta varia]|uniref:lipase 3-like n=1 Tax=Frieseomelitta varia TaxID=561572 RepID=UPI001CB688A5
MTMFKTFILCCLFPVILGVSFTGQYHEANEISDTVIEDQALTPKEIAQKADYVAETYQVVTEDRYVLQLDRIAGSVKSPPSGNKPAVLLLHGLLDCSSTWLLPGPEKSLGFILADWGYDVWLGNVRGNRYSRKHLDFTPSDQKFWMFSWHEIGTYDIPAMIDHITEKTEQKKIFMISHSQGSTAFFVMASERPEYQEKIVASF